MQLGCSTILYGALPLDTALEGIQRAGYKAIELCAIQGMAPHLPDFLPIEGYLEIGKKVADRGLVIESIGNSTNILDGQAAFRLSRLIHAAAVLGAHYITTGPGGKSDDEESFKKVVGTLGELAKTAGEYRVMISLKPHVGNAMWVTEVSDPDGYHLLFESPTDVAEETVFAGDA